MKKVGKNWRQMTVLGLQGTSTFYEKLKMEAKLVQVSRLFNHKVKKRQRRFGKDLEAFHIGSHQLFTACLTRVDRQKKRSPKTLTGVSHSERLSDQYHPVLDAADELKTR